MGTNLLNSGYGQASEWNTRRQPENDSLRTLLLCALLLAVCCLCSFGKWSNNLRRKPLKEPGQHTLIQGAAPQDRVQASGLERPNNDVLCQIDGPRGQISSLVFPADGKHMVCACKAEKTIQMLNIEDNGERKPLMNLAVAVNAVASSKDGKLIVTGDVDGNVVVWDTSLQKRCEAAEQRGKIVTALDVSDSHIASGSNDGTVVVWEMGEREFPLAPGPSMYHGSTPVSSVKFSPASSHIASACADWGCSVKIWHTRTRQQVTSIPIPSGLPAHSLAWSNDGRRLFAGCHGGSISCFDMVTRKPFSKVVEPRPGDDSITSLRVSNSGQFLVSFSAPARTVDVWDIRDTPARKPLHSYSRCVSASLSPDDLYLASSGPGDNAKITIRNLSRVVEVSYFFHRLAPLPSHPEPFTYISPSAHRAWKSGELEQAENILSREIEDKRYQGFNCYARANRALVRVRLGKLKEALDDAREIMTDGAHIPPIAHVAQAMAFMGQEKQDELIDAFGSVHHGDAKNFVECIKSLIQFEVKPRDQLNCGTELTGPPPVADAGPCAWVKTRKLLLLAQHCMRSGEYDEGLQFLAKAPNLCPFIHVPEAKIIQLIFGWDIYDLECMVQQLKCQALFASGRTPVEQSNLLKSLQVNKNRLDEESEARNADLGWLGEKLGDEAMRHKKFDDAITWYSVSLDLYPDSRVIDRGWELAKERLSVIDSEAPSHVTDGTITRDLVLMACYPPGSARLLVKRSKAAANKKFWENALKDADQAIKMDGLCLWGYEQKFLALHALRRYEKATETLGKMFTMMEGSADPSICQLRTKFIAPAEIIKSIDEQIDAIHEISPLVLIYVRTGKLYDAAKRIQSFKSDPIFHELVSSMSTELDTIHIEKTVARYFRYVMFSHTWEGKEPTFQDVSGQSIHEPDPDPLKLKLRRFCEVVRDDPEGYLWAWSDTCCIDKTIETVFRKSIRFMYSWYKESALTIVLLAHGSTTLKNNRWMTRAWTLQELLSPKSVRFYNRNWKLYQGDPQHNHKESSHIMRELAEAIGVTQDTLVDFSPKSLGIRAKLRLASTREATEKVDIAYALIGIFSSDLIPEYRDPEVALGLLLQEIVHREHDAKAVLDLIGKSSQFNSCLPAQISAYQDSPFTPPPIPEDEMASRVAELRVLLPQQEVTTFFEKLSALGSIDFTHRRLSLPCITFSASINTTGNGETSSSSQSIVYQVQAVALGQLKFKTSQAALMAHGEVVLVYPWIRDLLAQTNSREWDHYTRALRLVVHLEQPFRALLLVKQSVDTYERVAVDNEILVPQRKVMSLKDIGTAVLKIR